MKEFRGKLTNIKDDYEALLETIAAEGHAKDGLLYLRPKRSKERIEQILYDIEHSETKSAWDIHISSDDF